MQKLKDLFEKMDMYIEQCYRQYIDHFKSGFPYVSAQSFNEGEKNMGITNTFNTFLHFKQAYYMKQYRATKKTKINDLQKEEKLKKTEKNRLKEKL